MTSTTQRLVRRIALPDWRAEASARGLVLDQWPLNPGPDDRVSVRFVKTIEERDEARSYYYLGLTPP